MNAARQPVSNPSESLVLVDNNDTEIGFCSKAECHQGEGLLHRAFSVFIFNTEGKLLLQQRSAQKPLWPLFWANSCCSHPRESEQTEGAARRRVREELHLECELDFLFKFKYQAKYRDLGAEHEFCHVFPGCSDQAAVAHPDEIADLRYIEPAELTREIAANGDRYSPWLKMEWQRIEAEFLDKILAGCASTPPR